MATMFTSSSQIEEENKPKRRRKPPSKVRKRKESKLCYMHLISVHKKKEKVQGFTRKRWETYRTCVGRWLGLQGVSKDVSEAHKHCVEVGFEHLPQDAGFHLTCYRRFTDIQRLAAAEKRLARTLEDPDAAGQSVPSSDSIGAKAATSETPRKKRRSRTRCFPVASAAAGPVPPGSCIICQKVDKHVTVGGKRQRDQLSQAKTLSAGQVLKAAEMREDSTVFDNVCVALEVRYHRSCYQQYTRILSRSMETTDEGEQDKLKRRRTRELAQLVLPCPTKSNISELVCVETLSADKLLDRLPQPSGTETTTESTEMSISVGCVSSHGMSPQCHIFTLEDNRTEAGYLSLLPVCKEEVSPEQQDRSPSLVQEEPEPPQIKEEQEEELLQRPEEAAGSTLTLLAVKSEADEENRDTEPIASTSTEHMKTQADVENCGTSQPTSDQLLSSHCSESDTEDSDDWEETREGQSALNKLNSELFQDLKSSKQTPPMRTHTGKKSWRCTECGKVLGYMSHLKAHMITHTGEKPFACTECDKVFGYMSDLKRHVRTHTGEKPFICTECGKVFRSMGNLKVHMNTHTGEKPFACTECVKMFNKKSDLKQHMNSHTGEKPFSCTVCSKAFSSLYTLNTHMRIHAVEKRFTCTKCGKVCVQISHLKYHMRTHTGEKPFTCTECGKAFSSMSNLKQHMITHTGEKPFTCIVCGERFSQNGTLKRHMNKLHP